MDPLRKGCGIRLVLCHETDLYISSRTFINNMDCAIEGLLQIQLRMVIHSFLDYTMHRDNAVVPSNKIRFLEFV